MLLICTKEGKAFVVSADLEDCFFIKFGMMISTQDYFWDATQNLVLSLTTPLPLNIKEKVCYSSLITKANKCLSLNATPPACDSPNNEDLTKINPLLSLSNSPETPPYHMNTTVYLITTTTTLRIFSCTDHIYKERCGCLLPLCVLYSKAIASVGTICTINKDNTSFSGLNSE